MKFFSSFQNNQGFVILFAVLISALVLLIGMGIFSISFKEQILASTSRESYFSFYAADAAMECVLYHEYQQGGIISGSQVSCGNGGVQVPQSQLGGGLQFNVDYGPLTTTCASVTIDRSNPALVRMVTRGFNICDGGQPDVTDPQLVERAIQVTFMNASSSSSGSGSGGGTGSSTSTTGGTGGGGN